MSGFAATWLAHAAAASLGLAVAGLVLAVALRGLRARPVQGYRLAALVLGAALVLPLVQAAAARLELGTALRAALGARAGEPVATSADAAVLRGELPAAASIVGPVEAATWLPPWLLAAQDAPARERVQPSRAPASVPEGVTFLARVRGTARSIAPWLVAVHAAGELICAARSLARLARTRGIVRRARPIEAGGADDASALLHLWRTLRARSAVGSRVRLRATDEIASPACFGGARPAILLPSRDVARGAADPAERARLRCALVHELVHLERNDSRAMLVQELFRAVFWFHPVAWWLVREIDRLREVSCDWIAVRRAGPAEGRVRRYASALVDYAARVPGPRTAWAGHGAALVGRRSSASQLKWRIDMLIALEARPPRRASRAALSLAVLVLGAAWGAQTAFAAVWAPQDAQPARLALDPLAVGAGVRVAREPVREAAAEPGQAAALEQLAALGYAKQRTPGVTLGFGYEPAGEALAAHLGREREHLMVVTEVHAGSLAERAGLERLDVLFEVDGEPLSSQALARAKQRLAEGGSLRLGLVRRGQAQVQQVGPFSDEVLAQGRAAVQRRNEDAAWPQGTSQSGAWPQVQVPDVEFWNDAARKAGEKEAARAAELQERALEYYAEVDPQRFRSDLDKALDVYRELAQEGRLNDETEKHRAFIERLLQGGDTEAYLERTRAALGAMTPEEFEKQVGRSLAKLDPAVRRGILERWGAFDALRNGPFGSGRSDVRARTGTGIGGGAGTGAGDVPHGLHAAKAELERQAREIERLRKRLEELERASGGGASGGR